MKLNYENQKPKKNNYVKSLLVLHGITQIEIANELGTTRAAISMILSGTKTSKRVKTAIARKLAMPFEKLWGKDEPRKYKQGSVLMDSVAELCAQGMKPREISRALNLKIDQVYNAKDRLKKAA